MYFQASNGLLLIGMRGSWGCSVAALLLAALCLAGGAIAGQDFDNELVQAGDSAGSDHFLGDGESVIRDHFRETQEAPGSSVDKPKETIAQVNTESDEGLLGCWGLQWLATAGAATTRRLPLPPATPAARSIWYCCVCCDFYCVLRALCIVAINVLKVWPGPGGQLLA